MKIPTMLLINLCVLVNAVPSLHAKQTNYYDRLIALFAVDDPKETERYLNSLSLEELLALSRQACPPTIPRYDHEARLEASFAVNLSLQRAKKKFPKQVLEVCLKGIKSSKENSLWRCEVMRWLELTYWRQGSTDDEVKKILSLCTEIAFAGNETVYVRNRALGTVSGLLHLRTHSMYYKEKTFREAIRKDPWNKRIAMKAAVEKGFRNPWEALLLKTGEKILSAVSDPKENEEFRFSAVGALRLVLKGTYSQDALDTGQAKLKALLAEESTPMVVAVRAGQVLMDLFGDLTILKEIEGRLPEAKKGYTEAQKDLAKAQEAKNVEDEAAAKEAQARARDTLEHCETLIRQLNARIKAKNERKESTE